MKRRMTTRAFSGVRAAMAPTVRPKAVTARQRTRGDEEHRAEKSGATACWPRSARPDSPFSQPSSARRAWMWRFTSLCCPMCFL